MSDLKISQLSEAEPLTGEELVPVVQNDGNGGLETRKALASMFGGISNDQAESIMDALNIITAELTSKTRLTVITFTMVTGDGNTKYPVNAPVDKIKAPFKAKIFAMNQDDPAMTSAFNTSTQQTLRIYDYSGLGYVQILTGQTTTLELNDKATFNILGLNTFAGNAKIAVLWEGQPV